MTAKARGIFLVSLVLSLTLGPAWTADSTAPESLPPAPDTSSEASSNHVIEAGYAPYPSYNLQQWSQDKRQLGFHGMRGKKAMESEYLMPDWSKRASLGFHGMRGKKWPEEDFDKRATMGFHGMRGKKWLEDNEMMIKKGNMGFQGMRGKKNIEDYGKHAAFDLHGMRGKAFDTDETSDLIPILDDDLFNEEMKRAMSGFHGMRGKKVIELGKRAMGFQGMRGKKDDTELLQNLEKRAMGFHGMRGKKDNELFDASMSKRAMGFHGMRGKKENELGFKRAMGFLGMRGKKADDEEWEPQEKITPQQAGFFGMRGKESGEDLDYLLTYLKDNNPAVERTWGPLTDYKLRNGAP